MWKAIVGSDKIIKGEILNECTRWLNIKNLYGHYLPIYIMSDNTTNTELNMFTDASQ